MVVKYYSEITKKFYNTSDECSEQENAFLKEQEEKTNAENEDKQRLDELYSAYQMTMEDVRSLQAQASGDFSELKTAAKDFVRKYGYIPEKYKSLVFFSYFPL